MGTETETVVSVFLPAAQRETLNELEFEKCGESEGEIEHKTLSGDAGVRCCSGDVGCIVGVAVDLVRRQIGVVESVDLRVARLQSARMHDLGLALRSRACRFAAHSERLR